MYRMHPEMSEAAKGKKLDRKTLQRAWGFASGFRKILFAYLILSIINAVIGVLPPMILRKLIDDGIKNKDRGLINWLTLLTISVAFIGALVGFVIRWLGARIGEGLIADIRKKLFEHVQKLPIGFFARTQTGSLMSRLNNDVVGAQQAFTYTLRTVITDLLFVLSTLVFLIFLSWKVTVLALLVVPVLIVTSRRVGKLQEKAAREQMSRNAAMNATMTERFNVSGALLVKLFGRPKEEAKAFGESADAVAAVGVRRAITGVTLMLLLPMVSAVGTAAVYWWGARAVIADGGAVTIGTVIAMASMIARLYGPLTDLASARVDFVTAFVSFERIFEVMDAKPNIVDSPNAVSLRAPIVGATGGGLRIEADSVWFRYPAPSEVSVASLETGPAQLPTDPSGWVLRDLSFVAEPGTLTAVVGPSGAGKTTLSSLVPRLYDVTQGSIRIDGIDLREIEVQSLRDNIGVVTQDAHLFHDTLMNNLLYAKPHATPSDVEAACRAAQIHELIASLPDGYKTMVGERGYRLSGGEKQRVALARMLLKNPAIVILDEATAHLDSETESQIQMALETALAGRTSIVIAHRLSTIQAADQILVVEAGQIVERGRHEELAGAGGLYAELYETQFLRAAVTQ
jgi:ATP-binding cassette, subfamily B, bacterial